MACPGSELAGPFCGTPQPVLGFSCIRRFIVQACPLVGRKETIHPASGEVERVRPLSMDYRAGSFRLTYLCKRTGKSISVRADPERVIETHPCCPAALPLVTVSQPWHRTHADRFETKPLSARHSIAWMGLRLPVAPGWHLLASAEGNCRPLAARGPIRALQ
jgi:hypothetical protein